jgi:hypothetical protein
MVRRVAMVVRAPLPNPESCVVDLKQSLLEETAYGGCRDKLGRTLEL